MNFESINSSDDETIRYTDIKIVNLKFLTLLLKKLPIMANLRA